ncbi:MAG: preprotein translocase subunit SecY [Lachnospiraceae bacterium]|jgi:preprotein translocase subunit SecY|nr:preprotein translocase subunit SecY [Lachnospiraceae bacterium]NBJ82124.1 preprotein translocase subunit SecY [bacterium 1XD42-76]NBK05404.1 preprotein translocase subunit SecY [bacterium 1XD42-94]
MLKAIQKAFKVKEIRERLLYTFLMLIVIRIGSCLPIPGVDPSYLKTFFDSLQNSGMGFVNAVTGGSFSSMSLFALSITPYITSSIIMQLMTIAVPKLEEMQREGEDGRKKIAEYTRYLTVGLALFESSAMAVGLGNQGFLYAEHRNFWGYLTVVAAMTAGSALLMWIGERITEKGIGNGISIVLLVNIVSSLPQDVMMLYERFMAGKSVAVATVAAIIVLAVVLATVVFVLLLNGAERRIPVQYSKKMQGRRMIGGQSTYIPLKVNTANVIPVIFAQSIISMPVMVSQFFQVDYSTIGGKILLALSTSNWFKPEAPGYSAGLILYILLIVLFAYFYTSITFNPLEVANNMKKSGGFIPGIRPGKPTSDYLNDILNYIVFIGAVGLVIVCIIPIIASGLFSVGSLSFGGTSLIIIAGVILETIKAVESMMLVRNYKGFLND